MKPMRLFIFLILSFQASQAFSYPWIYFFEKEKKHAIELDLHGSYFLKEKPSFFGGVSVDYYNSKISIDLDYRYSFLDTDSYFRFGELSTHFPVSKSLNIALGFRDFVWSEADRYWNYGLWQPRYLLDSFRPVQTSLPGVYLDYTSEGTTFVLYGSYFYLPDIIAFPELKDGKLFTHNPFFSQLYAPDGIDMNIQELRSFELESFLQPLYALYMSHEAKNSRFSLAYAYKPINQLRFKVLSEGINLSAEDDEDSFSIQSLDYFNSYHHLLTAESEFRIDNTVSVFMSLNYDGPVSYDLEENWLTDELEPQLTGSLLLYFKEEQKDFERVVFTIGYTKTFEGQSADQINNVLTEELEYLFKRDLDWKHAASWSMEYWTKRLFEDFEFNVRLNYSLDNHIYVLTVDSYIGLTPSVRIYASGDSIFTSDKQSNNILGNSSGIIKYENLSRVLGGIKYVF